VGRRHNALAASLPPAPNAAPPSTPQDAATDEELLARFVCAHDPAAFETLVRRHGPMVLRLCQRLLRPGPDADDAFQATFIVLVRKAQSIVKQQSLASWLYGVAYRIALRARVRAERRLARERHIDEGAVAGKVPSTSEADLRPVLDEELNRLPEKYRTPVVLCYLEGKTNEEAAQQLQWPTGTVKIRLSRARELLRHRLTRRGLTFSAGALLLALTQETASAAVPQALASAATQAVAGGALPAGACALADAALHAMTVVKLKIAAGVVLAASVLTTAAVLVVGSGNDGPPVQLRATLEGHSDGVFALAFLADGRTLATGGGDRVIRLWDVTSGHETAALSGHRRKILSLAASPDGALLASGEGDLDGPPGVVKLWDLGSRREVATLPEHEQGASSLAFSPDSRLLASAAWGGRIRLWEVGSRRLKATLTGHRSGVAQLCFSPDGSLLASASNDQTVKLWKIPGGTELATLTGHTDVVQKLAFSTDGARLVSGSRDGTVRIWDVRTHEQLLLILAGTSADCVAFAPGDRVVLSGHQQESAGEKLGVLRLWDAEKGKPLASWPAHRLEVGPVVFSRDGKLLATASWDRTAKLWDVNSRSRAWAPGR
jgi:RNA polymerase sigma factor (sigma-70 family)